MDLVRELLDQQIVDREGRKAGKVDGLVAELREGAPPRLVALEVGPGAAARRLGARLARLFPRPVTIPIDAVRKTGPDVRVDLDLGATRIFAFERWLARHVIGRIPGA